MQLETQEVLEELVHAEEDIKQLVPEELVLEERVENVVALGLHVPPPSLLLVLELKGQ